MAALNMFTVKSVEFFGSIGRFGMTTNTDGESSYSYDADLSSATIDENGEITESFNIGDLASISLDESGVASFSVSVPVTKLGTRVEVGADNSGNRNLGVVQNIGKYITIGVRAIMNPGENSKKSAEILNQAREETRQVLTP